MMCRRRRRICFRLPPARRERGRHFWWTTPATNAVNPTSAWTAGAMISTVGDVARFYYVLLAGRLLPPAEQRELLATIPVDDSGELFAEHYGLGIYSVQLSCGAAWGHDSGWPRQWWMPAPNVSARAGRVRVMSQLSAPDPKTSGSVLPAAR